MLVNLGLSIVLLFTVLLNNQPQDAETSTVHVITQKDDKQLKNARNPQILKNVDGLEFPLVENPDQLNIVINKKVTLSSSYIPDDLVVPNVNHTSGNKKRMRKEAAQALEALFAEAKQHGHSLLAASGFRSYETQANLYNRYVATYGNKAADTFSARPGQSEHQLGLTMDYTSKQFGDAITEKIDTTPEGKWVKDNAHRFGFIIRYPLGKEHITGYKYEPWHLRYVGKDLANEIYLSGKTMEEYYLMTDDE